MKVTQSLVLAGALLSAPVAASSADNQYAPYNVTCPDGAQFVRRADSLSQDEQSWLNGRDPIQRAALIDWLSNSNLTDFDAQSFLSNSTVRLALAFSGGGYRAMLAGAGEFAAADNRTINSTNPGHMGGLVQAATYVSGLSGGNWLLGSLVVNNFTDIQTLQGSKDVWDLSNSIVAPGGINIFKDISYWNDISDAVQAKMNSGFNGSFTDIWGRALSYQFFGNFSDGGSDILYSYVRNYEAFQNYQTFFPIHVTDSRQPGTLVVSENSTIFEFNPFELGSWDPTLYAFTDLQYLGSDVDNGSPNGTCVNGFDNVGFLVGTSSTLFNQFLLRLNGTSIPSVLKDLLNDFLEKLGSESDDIAIYDPNPFTNVDYVLNNITSSPVLDLVDGGEDGQNVPLVPLLQPERNIDIVFAFDNSADTLDGSPVGAGWADGTSVVQTYARQFSPQGNSTIFPYVPDVDTFIYGGYTLQPTFFGCNRDNLTSLFNESQPESDRHYPPVIVFVANALHSYQSNTSTFKMSYDTDEVAGIIQNGYNILTQNNGTIDSEWRTCVACAVILREQQRRGEQPTDQCNQCFSQYCWDGNTTAPYNGTINRRDGKSNLVNAAAATAGANSSSSSTSSKGAAGHITATPVGLLAAVLALFSML